MPVQGGDPSRLTWHPMTDRVLDWHPDGTRVLFASSRESGRQRYNQFYLVAAKGGPAEKLPVPYGEFATYSPDGKQVAYLPQSQAFRTWKRYRGGWAPDVWTFDLATRASANVTASDANDEHPMWHGDTLYFLSDRGANQRANIWARDKGGALRQVTQFADFDVTFPALGPQDIVFEAGGRLYLLNLATEKATEVAIQVVTDRTTLKPRTETVDELIREAAPSPTGKRAVFQARGDVFTVPAEHGPVLNLTRSSGSAERYPRWSPDGKTLAYWTDRSGEYELVLRPADGTGTEKTVTTLGPGYRYPVQWSPDSARLAFIDQTETHPPARRGQRQAHRDRSDADLDGARQPGEPAAALVGRLALADVGAARQGDGQHGDLPLRHDRREEAPGHARLLRRRRARLRSRRQVSLLPLEPLLRAGLRRLRQQLDVSQLDPHRGDGAAPGRRLAARRPQRRRRRRQGQGEGR